MSENITLSKQRVAELLEENRLLKELQGRGPAPEVVIRIAPTAPSIVVPIGKGESYALESNSRKTSIAIPQDVYLTLKRDTQWFELGYLYSDLPEDLDNPNLVRDVAEWVKSRNETQIRQDIKQITSEGALNSLYEHTEQILFRQDDERRKTGKIRVLRQEALERLSEISGYKIIEDGLE